MPLVEIAGLTVSFDGVEVVHGIDLAVEKGEALGLVGESGCGKSVTWLAALGLLPRKARISGRVALEGRDLLTMRRRDLEQICGGRIAMIFQDPGASLNPVMRLGRQVEEALALHRGISGAAARAEARRLFDLVGIPDAGRRLDYYPHELSGGQNQRVMIAMALAGEPDLLIADEPTTALDATIQAQILDLLAKLREETGMALVFISHDLGAVAQVCERACVMYAGRIIESGPTSSLFGRPWHPYTDGLFKALPRLAGPRQQPVPIEGTVPDPSRMPAGCAFAPRCPSASEECRRSQPRLMSKQDKRAVACFHPLGEQLWDREVA